MSDFRPQAKPRASYTLNPDYMMGLRNTVRNNQPLMALEYVARALEEVIKRVDHLEAEFAASKITSKTQPKAVTKPAPKQEEKEEEEPT